MDETTPEAVPCPAVDHSLRVITIRVPASLHTQLKALAHQRQQSMNQLAVNLFAAATQTTIPLQATEP